MAGWKLVEENGTKRWPTAYLISVAIAGLAFLIVDEGIIFLEGAASSFSIWERVSQFLTVVITEVIPVLLVLELVCLLPAFLILSLFRWTCAPQYPACISTGVLVGAGLGFLWVEGYTQYYEMSLERYYVVWVLLALAGALAGWVFAAIDGHSKRWDTLNRGKSG